MTFNPDEKKNAIMDLNHVIESASNARDLIIAESAVIWVAQALGEAKTTLDAMIPQYQADLKS